MSIPDFFFGAIIGFGLGGFGVATAASLQMRCLRRSIEHVAADYAASTKFKQERIDHWRDAYHKLWDEVETAKEQRRAVLSAAGRKGALVGNPRRAKKAA